MALFRYTIDQRLKEHSESIIQINLDLTAAVTALTNLTSRVSSAEASINELTDAVISLRSSVSAHTTAINNALARIHTLEEQVADHERRITALENA